MRVLFFTILVASALVATLAEEINVQNNCGREIFVKGSGVNTGSFSLGNGQSRSFSINRGASARVWAHVGCNNGGNCDTTEGYVSLAEMHWDNNGMTWYDVSQVDGYNIPVTMQPYTNSGGNCESATCHFNIDQNCPQNDKVWKDGRAVACRNPNRDAETDYSRAIKRSCPKVYSWSKDDQDGMRACQPGNPGLNVIFC